jgi:ABC-2 type transport system ATP-binding protein
MSAEEPVVDVAELTKRYRDFTALDQVGFRLEAGRFYGLLGRNGAGKTTIMSILSGQNFETSGRVSVFGAHPYENAGVLRRLCFIRESQKYPDFFTPANAFDTAAMFFDEWSEPLRRDLVEAFQLPLNRRISKLSRGQLSAVGVIIGLASRAPLTFFDEPYLGLDAVARQLFYDRLLADYAEHPRTIVLSSHLIDEVADLLEHVIVVDQGRILIDEDAETIRGSAFTVAGRVDAVDDFVAGHDVLHRDRIGALTSVTAVGRLDDHRRAEAATRGLELGPVSLQQLIVRRTIANTTDPVAGSAPEMETVR